MNFDEYVKQEHRKAFEEKMIKCFPDHFVAEVIDNLDDDLFEDDANINTLRLYLDGIQGMDADTFMNYDNRRLVQSALLEKLIYIWTDYVEAPKTAQLLMNHPFSVDTRTHGILTYANCAPEEMDAAQVVCMANHNTFNDARVCTSVLTAWFNQNKRGNRAFLDLISEYSNKSGLTWSLSSIMENLKEQTLWIEKDRNVPLTHLLVSKPDAMQWFVSLSQQYKGEQPLASYVAGNCETANIAAKDIQAIMAMLLHVAMRTTNPAHKWQLGLKMGLTLCRDKYEDREFPGVREYLQSTKDSRLIFLSGFAGKKNDEKISALADIVKRENLQEFSEKVIKISQRSTPIKNKLLVLIANPEHKNKGKIMRNAIEHELGM
jgi:hypothetical protein